MKPGRALRTRRNAPATGRTTELLLTQKNSLDNYAGDIDTVNKWAEILKLSDWFGWIDFEQVPENYATTMS